MKYIAFILLTLMSMSALADCTYNGRSYPVGMEIAGLVCQANGTWR